MVSGCLHTRRARVRRQQVEHRVKASLHRLKALLPGHSRNIANKALQGTNAAS